MNHQRVPTEQRSKALQSYYANLEANRAKMRERAKAAYYANKELKLLRNSEYRRKNLEKWKLIKQLSNKKYNKRRFFFARACHIALRVNDQSDTNTIARALSLSWYKQRGRCAYTGQRLDRTAQVDHKVPISRGGLNNAENLHWVTARANCAKGTMTHDEFLNVCTEVASYIEAFHNGL